MEPARGTGCEQITDCDASLRGPVFAEIGATPTLLVPAIGWIAAEGSITSPNRADLDAYPLHDLRCHRDMLGCGVGRCLEVRRWWNQMGRARFPEAQRLLITADAGGSNGYRLRAWKVHLAALAAETGLRITVCHYPPGTSKWNRIEHRMFSFITINWRGRPLTTLRTIIELISATTTDTWASG